jgi:phosphomannomutase
VDRCGGRGIVVAVAAPTQRTILIATDADGDRPLVADETGPPLPGDLIAWLAAVLAGADTIATPVTSNSALQDRSGLTIRRKRIGSPFVIAAMDAAIAAGARRVAGFEANGGFLLATKTRIGETELAALPTRDSTLPILATLSRMKSASLKASALATSEGFRATAGGRLKDFAVERSKALIAALADRPGFAAAFLALIGEIAGVDSTDGLRYALANGRIVHFRPSGNAPEMRCYAEAGTVAEANRILAAGLQALAAVEA